MTQEDMLSAIKANGYWRVLIRPTVFEARRIQDRTTALQLVDENKIMLRGWDYPHLDPENQLVESEWIGSAIDWGAHKEYWRLYLSGQFIHYFAMMEDFHQVPWTSSAFPGGKPEKYMEIISTLYTVTEVYEFAKRLTTKEALGPSAEISITLFGTEGRVLVYWDILRRLLERNYVSAKQQISSARIVSAAELTATSSQLALNTTVDIFEQFNWLGPPIQLLEEDQRKLFERRLGT